MSPWELNGYWELRREIFVDEQRLFEHTDRDRADARALPIVAISQSFGMEDQVVGVVRVFADDRGVYWGGRLGVERSYRRQGEVGEGLIQTAVGTARGLGCCEFLATVQIANVRYFERHHFHVLGEQLLFGQRHALMRAELACFPRLSAPNIEAAA